jgi:cytochrome c biogenesis factor
MRAQERKKYYTESISGNTVRKLKPAPGRIALVPAKENKQSIRHRKNLDKARYMNLGYVLFLVGALMVTAITLSTYIGLQSDITNSVKQIARLERELNNIKLANDENYSRITNNIDLDHIRRVAIQELGMTYAKEGQIIAFAGNKSDYVRQLNSLP